MRIDNQGACGSCWAFAAMGTVDARLCIASQGRFNGPTDVLSRLQLTTCGVRDRADKDGCKGGWPHWAYTMMGHYGIVSDSCLPYYIGGEGVEHFTVHSQAPPCATHCQGGYHKSFAEDSFTAQGMEHYDWLHRVHADSQKHREIRESLYHEGPVAISMQARVPFFAYRRGIFSLCGRADGGNHAVRLYGWGVHKSSHFYHGSNSWGPDWGMNGHFLMNEQCVADAFIPGRIQNVNLHPVDVVYPNEPKDPYNANWPWPAARSAVMPRQCAIDTDGCVDVGGSEEELPSSCVSDVLNGKPLRVVRFDTEAGYDILTVNGRQFTGSGAGVEALSGLVVDGRGLHFESDATVPSAGFKLCPAAAAV